MSITHHFKLHRAAVDPVAVEDVRRGLHVAVGMAGKPKGAKEEKQRAQLAVHVSEDLARGRRVHDRRLRAEHLAACTREPDQRLRVVGRQRRRRPQAEAAAAVELTAEVDPEALSPQGSKCSDKTPLPNG